MANAIYPLFKQAMLTSDTNSDIEAGTLKVAMVTSSYTYSAAHQFYTSISAAVIGTPQTLGSKTITNGTFDAADASFASITGTPTALVFYIDTGVAGTSRLVAYLDTNVGLPVTSAGGAVNFTWNASGIFTL